MHLLFDKELFAGTVLKYYSNRISNVRLYSKKVLRILERLIG